MSKKILILTGDCAEDYEVKVPQQSLQMLGYQVDIAAPNKKTGICCNWSYTTSPRSIPILSSQGHRIPVDVSMSEVKADDYAGLVVPGGRAPEYIRMYDETIKLVQDFFAAGKPVAVICHGLQLLAAAKVLEGYKVTSYPACAPECRLVGADWQSESVIIDKNLVTAQAWPNHPAWLKAFVELLGASISI